MGFFDDFNIDQMFSRVFGRQGNGRGSFEEDPFGGSVVVGWVSELMQSASTKWLPVLLAGIRCATPDPHKKAPCGGSAVTQCGICSAPTCLRHAMVHANGDVVCVLCVNTFYQQVHHRPRPAPPPPPASEGRQRHASAPNEAPTEEALRKKYLRTLGLKDPASWEEIHSAYKTLMFKHHPDRASAAKKPAAAQKSKDLNAAYEWLRAREQKAA